MDDIRINPIGVIHSPFKELAGMPIQPVGARDVAGQVVVAPPFADGLADMDGFSHIILIYFFHRTGPFQPKVKPFLDNALRGLFATRAPSRPNPIGLSVVRLISVEENVLRVQGIDVLDGTPLLDIKPYVARFDAVMTDAEGWLTQTAGQANFRKADSRFTDD
ncbi:MAG: tRNA (N6-threonylcarbamoyladenosine(37)-N6)-methyltransferase TrmO [Desulfobacterales bacterium]|nr:tRNA (N6-threonylcarbamoyladenosine(37)-N6)-methyltransferase TrmO [Desulfobacterales bacterium]